MTNEDSLFFLSKNSANLAQQMHYLLDENYSRIVLTGEIGIGKTAFMQFFVNSYFRQSPVYWIDLSQHSHLKKAVQKFDLNDSTALWVFDHAEVCSSVQLKELETLLQVIQGMSVVVLQRAFYSQWQQVTPSLLLKLNYLAMAPLSYDESVAFCEQQIKYKTQKVTVELPWLFSFKIRRCGGSFKKLKQLLEWNEDKFTGFSSKNKKINTSSLLKVSGLVVLVGLVWFLPVQQEKLQPLVTVFVPKQSSMPVEVTSKNGVSTVVKQPVVENFEGNDPVDSQQQSLTFIVRAPEMVEPLNYALDNIPIRISNDGATNRTIAEPDVKGVVPERSKPFIISKDSLLYKTLEHTKQWLSQEHNQWAKQLLVFPFDSVAEKNFARYIQQLEQHGVDTSLIHVYEFKTNKTHAFSVLYGAYETKQLAKVNSSKLKAILKTETLILRSANGIRDEIKNSKLL